MYIHVPYENWRFPNWLKSHLSLAPPFINTMYVTTWPISKRGNKWEMLSYEAWTNGRTAVCHNKPVFWRAYKNEWPISWNYEYIIFGQIIFQNFHQFKAFVGLSDCRTIGPSDYRTIRLSDYRTVGLSDCRIIATAPIFDGRHLRTVCFFLYVIKCMLIFGVKLPIRYPFHEIWVSLRLNLRWLLYESSIFFYLT